jgi:translocation and assembly module TamB
LSTTQRRWLRGPLYVLGAIGVALALLSLVVSLALGSEAGRARLLATLLARVNEVIPGRLEVRELSRLDPWGATLLGVELRDPTSARVVSLATLHVELAPRALLRGRIVLEAVRIGPGQIDLEELGTPGRGILAALVDPEAPAATPSSEPPPVIVVEEVALDDLEVRAPRLAAPWHPLVLRHIQARAELAIDPDPRLVLRSLSLDVARGERLLARLTRGMGRLARPGESSEAELALELGEARLTARASAVLAPQVSLQSQPLGAELELSELTAGGLAVLLDDPSLASAFEGPLSLAAQVSGTLERLALQARVGTAGGPLALQAELTGRRQLGGRVELAGVSLGRVRAGLPMAPASVVLESTVELGDPAHVPFQLRVPSAALGEQVLPVLTARGIWLGSGVAGLELTVLRGGSRLHAEGHVETAGTLDLKLLADLGRTELDELAAVAGLPSSPGASLRADLRVARGADGRWLAQGTSSARAVRLPDLALKQARVELDVAGVLPLLEGTAHVVLAGVEAGALRVPRLEVHFDGSPQQGRVRASGQVEQLQAALDLRVERREQSWRLRGGASGRYRDEPFVLALEPTTIEPAGVVDVAGLDLRAGGQQLHVSGSYGRPGAELVARAAQLDVATLAGLAGLGTHWTGSVDLALRLGGQPERPVLAATFQGKGLSPNGERPVDVSLAAALDAGLGRASVDVALSAGGGSRLAVALASELAGGVDLATRIAQARHHLVVDVRQLELAALEAWLSRPLPVRGSIDAAATISGTLQQPSVHARLNAQLPNALGLRPLELSQRIDYDAGRLATELAVEDAAGRWLSLTGELELPPEDGHDVTAVAARVATLGDRARYNARLEIGRRRLGSVWPDAPKNIAGIVIDGDLQASHEAGAEPSARAALQVVESNEGGATTAAATPKGVCGAGGVRLSLLAALAGGTFSAKLTALSRETELMRAEARAAVRLVPALRGVGSADLGALAAELSSRGLVLEQVPFLCQRVRGRVDARVRLADALGNEPSLLADVAVSGASLGATPSLDLQLEARADRTSAVAEASISAPTGRSTVSAKVPISWSRGRVQVTRDAPLVMRAQLNALPLAPLVDPAGALSYVTGFLSGGVVVGGTVGQPEPSGKLELTDAELTATALAQPLHGVKGRFSFTRSSLEIEGFEARDRDGVLNLSGNVARSGADALRVQLDARAKRFPLRQRGQVVATTSGRAKIDATLTAQDSRVSVKLMDADTWLEQAPTRRGIQLEPHPDFVVAKPVSDPAGPEALAAAGAADEPPRESHISIDATDRFWIKRDDFAIQLSARLEASIEGARAKVEGRVDIYRGYLDLMGRVFDVERGSYLDFTGGSTPDPVVVITATYEQRSSGQTVKVQIQGRGSKPQLKFFVDDAEVSAGEALEVLVGGRSSGSETSAKQEATSFVSGLTAGLLATSARRELGAAAPIIMIEPGEQTGAGRIRAGFELDTLVPAALRSLITGIYVEGIVEREGSGSQGGQGQPASTQAGVLLELYFPHQLFTTGQYGPGTTWSLDWGWQL